MSSLLHSMTDLTMTRLPARPCVCPVLSQNDTANQSFSDELVSRSPWSLESLSQETMVHGIKWTQWHWFDGSHVTNKKAFTQCKPLL